MVRLRLRLFCPRKEALYRKCKKLVPDTPSRLGDLQRLGVNDDDDNDDDDDDNNNNNNNNNIT